MDGYKLIKDVQEVKTYTDGFQSMLSKIKKKEQLYVKKCLKNQLYLQLIKIKRKYLI